MPIEDENDPDRFFPREETDSDLPPDVAAQIEHLRETLSSDQALASFLHQFEREPESEEELDAWQEELILQAYDAEAKEWSDDLLFW